MLETLTGFYSTGAPLTPDAVEAAAKGIGVEVAVLQAVIEIESAGAGFIDDPDHEVLRRSTGDALTDLALPTRLPRILYEPHVFGRLVPDPPFGAASAGVWAEHWGEVDYVGGLGEWERLAKAMTFDAEAALKSASWGLFQIMGFNHEACGFGTVQDFAAAMARDEAHQLQAVLGFLKTTKLVEPLRAKDWAAFARGYNGPGYWRNRYAQKLAQAYDRARGAAPATLIKLGSAGARVVSVQKRLGLVPDGIFGPKTHDAVVAFQQAAGLTADGIVGRKTWGALFPS